MTGMTDIHTHFVYGVDDGAQSFRDMRELIDEDYRQGVRRIFATSHMTPGLEPFDADTYQKHLETARVYCADSGYDLKLETGAELLYTPAMDSWIRDRRLTMLGRTEHLLVEFVPMIRAGELIRMLDLMDAKGYRPILAHIERYACMKGELPFRLKKNYDVQYQVNCRTVIRPGGLMARLRIQRWLKSGLIDYVASDMHNVDYRPPMMDKAYEALKQMVDGAYAESLVTGAALEE